MIIVRVPGIPQALRFPDGTPPDEMRSAIDKLHEQTGAKEGIPSVGAEMATPRAPEPSFAEKLQGGLEAAGNIGREVMAFAPSMAAGVVGFAGALANDVGVKMGGPGEFVEPTQAYESTATKVHDLFTKPAPGMENLPAFDPSGKQIPAPPPGPSPVAQDYEQKVMGNPTVQAAMMTGGAHAHDMAVGAQGAPGIALPDAVARANAMPGEAAGAIASKAVRSVLPKADATTAGIAAKADQFPNKMVVRPDQLVDEGDRRATTQSLSTGFLSGGAKLKTQNKKAFTANLIDQIDNAPTSDRLTPETFDAAVNRQGERIDNGYNIAGDIPASELADAMQSAAERAQKYGAGNAPKVILARGQGLLDKADENGNVPAEALREWDSDVGRSIRSNAGTDPELADYLMDLQSGPRDAMMGRLTPEQAEEVVDARRRYAYSMMLVPDVAKAGGEGSFVGLNGLVEPGKLRDAITRTKRQQQFMARGNAGPIGDLAEIGRLLDSSQKPEAGEGQQSPGLLRGTVREALEMAGRPILGQVLNRTAGRTSAAMIDEARPPEAPAAPDVVGPAPAPAAPPTKPLLLGHKSSGPSGPAVPVTPEGQALMPGQVRAREDFQTSQRVAGGTGSTATPESRIQAPDLETRLGAANYREPAQPPAPGPLGDLTPDWTTSAGAGAPPSGMQEPISPFESAENRVPEHHGTPPSRAGRDIPAVPGRPDLADTMVSGRPGETANDKTTGEAMQSSGAEASRRAQEAAKPNAAEQAKLDEIRAAKASATSPVVRESLAKEEVRVLKEVGTRQTLETAKTDAAELRKAAATITDPATKQSLLARADRLDPQPKEQSNAVQTSLILKPGKDAGGAKGSRAARPAGQGATGNEGASGQGGPANAAAAPTGQQGQGNASAGKGSGNDPGHKDAVVEAVDRARFDVTHPRGSDGRFAPKSEK